MRHACVSRTACLVILWHARAKAPDCVRVSVSEYVDIRAILQCHPVALVELLAIKFLPVDIGPNNQQAIFRDPKYLDARPFLLILECVRKHIFGALQLIFAHSDVKCISPEETGWQNRVRIDAIRDRAQAFI
jgi:hypothetical protein